LIAAPSNPLFTLHFSMDSPLSDPAISTPLRIRTCPQAACLWQFMRSPDAIMRNFRTQQELMMPRPQREWAWLNACCMGGAILSFPGVFWLGFGFGLVWFGFWGSVMGLVCSVI